MADIPVYDKPLPEVADHPLFSGATPVGLMSAEAPRFPVQVQGQTQALRQLLQQQGLRWEETRGDYDGPEHSFIVHGPSRDQMYRLGKVLGQESVVWTPGGHHNAELLYTNGPDDGRFHPAHTQYGFHPTDPPPSYWTQLPGRGYLRLHFDLDRKHRAPLREVEAQPAQEGVVTKKEIAGMLLAALRKVEPLAKRSKNVREQVRNITPQQAIMRRIRYAQGLGLKPKREGDVGTNGRFPAANRNTLPYSQTFPVEHETAHAMMTPADSTIRQYQRHLSAYANLPEGAMDNPDIYEEAEQPHEEAVYDENVANALENKIDRRAGVDPSQFRSKFRRPVAPETTGTTEGYGTGDVRDNPRHVRHEHAKDDDTEPFTPEIQDAAQDVVKPFDQGARFTPQGRIQQPQGVHQKINQGHAGVNWLRQTRQKLGMK